MDQDIIQTAIEFHGFNWAADPAHCTPAVSDWHRDFASAYHHKDVNFMRRIIGHPGNWNQVTKDFFTKLSGVKLPRTKHGILAALDQWAGINPDDREILTQIANESAKERASARELIESGKAAAGITVKIVGTGALAERISGDKWIQGIIGQGYDRIVLRATGGACARYALVNEAGNGYPVSGALLRYARAMVEAKNSLTRNS